MRKATTRIIAGALSAALVLTGVNMPNKSASAASAKLNKDRVVLYVGGNNTATIKAKNVDSVKFKSKDESVAKVNQKTGKVTAKGAGKTKVIAKTNEGKLKCVVRVYKSIKTLTPDTEEVTLAPGETQTVSVGVKPAKAQPKMWKVTTSDKTVAKKTKKNGKKGTFDINAVAEGTATMTISSTDGGSAADATVKVTVTDLYTADDVPEDIDEVPEQEDIQLLEKSALMNAAQDELYVWYATYDANGDQVDNPAVAWSVTDYAPNKSGDTIKYEVENIREIGCLVVKAHTETVGDEEDVTPFSSGDLISVYGKSMNSDASVLEDIAVDTVRVLSSIEVSGIVATDASGNRTECGNTLPFGFENSGNTYTLEFSAYDQNGNYMVNMSAVEWITDGEVSAEGNSEYTARPSDGVQIYSTAGLGDAWDESNIPLAIAGSNYCDVNGDNNADGYNMLGSGPEISGNYAYSISLEAGAAAAVGGSGYIVFQDASGNGLLNYEYIVGTTSSIASLELVAPEGRIHDGDGATIGINAIYEDGVVYENVPYSELEDELGKDAAAKMYATAPDTETAEDGIVLNVDDADATGITWTDVVGSSGGAEEIYGYDCFDDVVRNVKISLKNCPVPFSEVTLEVYDPSRPVSVSNNLIEYWMGYNVQNTDNVQVTFVDQYGETLRWGDCYTADSWDNDLGNAFWSQASTSGFSIDTYTTYFGVGLVVDGEIEKIDIPNSMNQWWPGIDFGLYAGETFTDASVFIVSYTREFSDNDLETILLNFGGCVGEGAYVGSVKRPYWTATTVEVSGTIKPSEEFDDNWTVVEVGNSATLIISDDAGNSATITLTDGNALSWGGEKGDGTKNEIETGDKITVSYEFTVANYTSSDDALVSLAGRTFTAEYTITDGDEIDPDTSEVSITVTGTLEYAN